LLRVGDIWSDRTLASTPDYQLETFPELLINDSTTSIVKAGSAIESSKFLIPFRDHPWHQGGTLANCVCVNLPDGRRLIVPCIEIIRFYFGSSSDLLTRLFNPLLKREHLYVYNGWDIALQTLTLHLAAGIRGTSAADVARIATSTVAWRTARSISVSCARASAAGRDAYPAMTFPFEGTTDLVASGKWLSHGDEPNRTFLVYSLRSCSHPFPFQKLRYKVSPRASDVSPGKPARDRSSANPKRVSTTPREGESLKEHEASKSLSERSRYVDDKVRFSDLERKSVWASRTLRARTDPALAVAAGDGAVALGDAVGQGNARPISLLAVKSAKEPPKFLRELIATLHDIPDVAVSLLTASEQDGWTIELSIGTSDRTYRLAVFLIEQPTAQATLIAFESDALIVLLRPSLPATHERLVDDAIDDVLSHLEKTSQEPDLAIDLDEEAIWQSQAGGWIQERLVDCNFPGHRSRA